MTLYSYKFRLQPTPKQEVLMSKHFGCCRYVYNHFLRQRIDNYQNEKKSSTYLNDANQLPTLKTELEWLKEVGSHSLQWSLKNLATAYDNFFRRLKEHKKGQKPGFPRFKKHGNKQSFKVPQGVRVKNNKLILPKFLEGIPIVLHRAVEGTIKFCTVSKNKAGQYHVSITVERDIQPLPETSEVIGVDLNVLDIVDSNGNKHKNPRPEEANRARLKLLSKAISRCEKGSKGREKAKKKKNKFKLYCHNVREDFLHKFSRKLVNENQVICCEDLSVESMLANKKDEPKNKKWLHRNLQDCGFASLLNKLKYKALWYGRVFVQVDRWFPSSQLCNNCNWRYEDLAKNCKSWTCWNCFENNDRDVNSARNILDEGYRILTSGTEGLAYCPDVRPALSGLLVG
jgi:putative transposase